MKSPKSTSHRTWTATEEPRTNKWLPIVLLSGLLCVGLYLFLRNVWWQSAPRVHFASVVVTDYGEMLPTPAYADWAIADNEADSTVWPGLEPWNVVSQGGPKSIDEIEQLLASLDDDLQVAGASSRDTLVVYLRCHCLVLEDELYLLPGEFDQSQVLSAIADGPESDRGAIRMADKLRQLQSLPTENVVVLADICDLTNVPQLGVLANDITAHIESAMQSLPADGQLWVIAAAANLQPSLISHVRRQTLLQSAAEYALNPGLAGDASYLSLASFYEAVLRYGHDVSGGMQTPALFRNGSPQLVNTSSGDWIAAQKVPLANISRSTEESSEQNSVADDSTDDVALHSDRALNRSGAFATRFVSAQSTSTEQPDGSTSLEPADEPESAGSPGVDGTNSVANEAALPPELRFWSIRERLLNRNIGSAGWSPVDFAVDELQRVEAKMLYLTRVERIRDWRFASRTSSSVASQEMSQLVEELERLEAVVRDDRSRQQASAGMEQNLVTAWNRFFSLLKSDSGRAAWGDPSVLPDSQMQRWEPIRLAYRRYMDVANRLSGWVEASLHDERNTEGARQLAGSLQLAVERLMEGSDSQAEVTAFDRPLRAADVQAALAADDRLRQLLTRRVQELERRLRNAQAEGKVRWNDERELRRLLQNRNLDFAARARLEELYRGLSLTDFARPGVGNENVDRELKVEDLLSSNGEVAALSHVADWAALVSDTNRLAGRSVAKPTSKQASGLNAWASDLLASRRDASAKVPSAVHQWNRACFSNGVLFPAGSGAAAGSGSPAGGGRAALIVPISRDTALESIFADTIRLPQLLVCEVKRRNGNVVRECYVHWRLANADDYQGQLNGSNELLRVSSTVGGRIEPEIPTPIEVSGGEVRLKLETDLDFSMRTQPLQMQIALTEVPGRLSHDAESWQTVRVTPPNPDRVRLFAKTILPPGVQMNPSSNPVLWSTEDAEAPVLKELSVPAVGQAKTEYELYLANLSNEDKWIRASIYSVRGAAAVGDGRVTLPAMQATRRDLSSMQPYFTTDALVLLPANSSITGMDQNDLPTNARPLQLVPAGDATRAGSSAANEWIGEFGLVCVVEEMSGGGDDAVALNDKRSFHWIDCRGENPARGLVDITPQASELGYELDVAVDPTAWSRYGLGELDLVAFVTDELGEQVAFTGMYKTLLKPDMPRDRLNLRPERDTGRPLVVHVGIGGYPRAATFQARLRDEIPREATQSFVWLDGNGLICTTADGTQIPTQQTDGKVIIPARENVDATSDGTVVDVAALSLLCQIDFPKIAGESTALMDFLSPTRYAADRRFQPRFAVKSGRLVFSAGMDDLLYEVDLRRQSLSGPQKLSAFVDTESKTGKAIQVVFDRDPPAAKPINISSRDLYVEEELVLEIDATDESGVRNVVFAVDLQNGEHVYDHRDVVLLMPAKQVGDRWQAVLKASALEAEDIPAGSYYVVARSIDNAGNFQDENTAERFRWTGEKRPVSKPPAKKKTATKSSPIKPPPTEFTVMVFITVDGAKPDYPEKTSISGVEGASKQNRGGDWLVLKVPAGSYNVEAKYADAFGVEYSGTGSLRVGPGLANRVTINATK